MTMEDLVRKQHELEDRIAHFQKQVKEFMRLAFRDLDVRQHEIAMARLYDKMTETANEAERIDHMFKGLLLKKTHARRKAGERPSALRALLAPDFYDANSILQWHFDYPIPLTEQLAHDWAAGNVDTTRKLLQERNR